MLLSPRSGRSLVVGTCLALGAALALPACARSRDAPARAEPPALAAASGKAGGGSGSAAPAPAVDRAMRITLETYVTVQDVARATQAVRDLTASSGGYVGEARTSGDDAARSASFELHVPTAKLSSFRESVAALGEITSDSEKAEDVTEERADIRARLGNARAEEKRMLELLEKQTGALADVVAVEKELARVRETIERMEAQERVLEGQIALATVKLYLTPKHLSSRVGPGQRVVVAAGEGIDNAGAFIVGTAVFLASAGPTLLLIGAIGYLVFRAVRALHLAARRKPT